MAVFVELSDDDDAPQDADARYAAECQARAVFETGGLGALSVSAAGQAQAGEIVNANRNSITERRNPNNLTHRPQHPRQPRPHLPPDPREPPPVPAPADQPDAAVQQRFRGAG
ncbi:hypothetical protein V493_05852 [Pseudogymnoascus sp. VKM F-4281 (FW-2241)]|nr:hypothetical protein V493_05852 [Pseudogymnoascus sp. VKM F-4281 (FW-2241)]